MQLFLNANFPFVNFRRKAFLISGIIALAGLISIVAKGGLRQGTDFAGGTLLQVRFAQAVSVADVRAAIEPLGYGEAEIQESHDVGRGGSEIMIRAPRVEDEGDKVGREIKQALTQKFGEGSYEVRREEVVGPKVGKELRRNALYATFISLGLLLVYISWRFDFRAGVAAVLALFHDVLSTVGALSITDREMTLTVLAGILTLVGFSVDNTIVVLDRIREDRRLFPREPLAKIVDAAINQTLSRTVITSGTIFIVSLCLFFFGGEVLHDFAWTLVVGNLIGTYGSIFVAGPILVEWEHWRPRGTKTGGKPGARAKVSEGRSRREEAGARV